MTPNNSINYIELTAPDLAVIKHFYGICFNWHFTDYGANYTAFSNSGINGGFEKSPKKVHNGALIVIHHNNLEAIRQTILQNGGEITVDIFSFPGGKRFQFKDPGGNELAVWTEM
ncbi:MAG: VOC family protein [Putridiphycobacter sp.]|nr:VOC family protein [Putridiphycobacter sp.]